MRGSDLLFHPLLVPVVEKSIESNILLLPNVQRLPLFVIRIAVPMGDTLRICNPLAQRLRGVFLRQGFKIHFLGNRSNFEYVADLFDEIPKCNFRDISRQLMLMARAHEHDVAHFCRRTIHLLLILLGDGPRYYLVASRRPSAGPYLRQIDR